MTSQEETRLKELLDPIGDGLVVFLTGAGISAESGIPTFRGDEGYWRVGSKNYHPQELATYAAWRKMPEELWNWYLYRRGVCRAANPNAAHLALAELERRIEKRLLVVTQNVDGLHLRAGNSRERTYEIHGNVDFMRCEDECTPELRLIPDGLEPWAKERRLGEPEWKLLACPECGARTRPHVLWFDETYDEARYRFESSMEAAHEASLLVIVGTSGATNLPMRMGAVAARRRIPLIVVNKDPSPFTDMAMASEAGLVLEGTAGDFVPVIAQRLS